MKNVRLFLSATVILVTSACIAGAGPAVSGKGEPEVPVHGNIYNFATYNVGVFNKSGSNSMDMVVNMMKEWNLDAVSLNELDSCNTRSGIARYQLSDFAKRMGGWNINFASAISYKGGTYGIGVATPFEIKASWSIRLPRENDGEVRALSVVETEKFVFCSTHLGLTEEARLSQVDSINAFIESRFKGSTKPVFLCGDFNAEPGEKTLYRLSQDWQTLSDTEILTFSTSNPVKCIDYILLYRHAGTCTLKQRRGGSDCRFDHGNPLTASDHFPVFISVEI